MSFRLILVLLLLLPLAALASGTDGHRLYDPNGKKEIDKDFEAGKAIFTGRSADVEKIRYCLFARGKLLKVKRSTIKSLKRLPVADFENSILDCDNPAQSAYQRLTDKQAKLVTYYLDKRYWLRLDGVASNY